MSSLEDVYKMTQILEDLASDSIMADRYNLYPVDECMRLAKIAGEQILAILDKETIVTENDLDEAMEEMIASNKLVAERKTPELIDGTDEETTMTENDSTEKTDLKQIGQNFVKALKGPAIPMGDVMVGTEDDDVDVEPFVGKYYMMQGSIEELLFDGHDLRNGMVVLTEDPMNRQDLRVLDTPNSLSYNNAFGMALMYNRWCTVTQLRKGDLQNTKIQFVGVYADGSKRKWRVDQDDAWLVKRDSIPEETYTAEEMQQAAFPEVISLSLNEEDHYKNIVGDAMTNVLAANGIMPDSRQNGGQFMAILDAAVEEFGRKKSALVQPDGVNNELIIKSAIEIMCRSNGDLGERIDATTAHILKETQWEHDLSGTAWFESEEGRAIYGLVHAALADLANQARTELIGNDWVDSKAGAVVTKILEHI